MSLPRTLKGIKERVKIVGDTMTGNLEISKTNSPIVKITDSSQGRRGEFMYNINEEVLISNYKDENSRTLLFLRNEDNTANLLQVSKVKDGQWSSYNLYGEHNKPSAKDVGALPINGEKYRVDLNTVLEQGSYMFYYEEGDQTTYHTPTNYISWINLLVIGMGTRITQIATLPYAHQRLVYVRYKHDSSWSEWDRVYTVNHKPTAMDIGALSLNGGTLTGSKISLLNGKGYISASNTLDIAILDTENDTNNRRILSIYDTNTKVNLKDSLLYVSIVDGKMSTYTIYGTHNKPTAADVGALSLTNGGTVTGGTTFHNYTLFAGGSGGYEGGEVEFIRPPGNAAFTDNIHVDVCNDCFRIFTAGFNNATKVFNFNFSNHTGGEAIMYHTKNIINGSGSTPSNLPDQGIYIRY